MEQEGPETGPGKLVESGTVGQPVVQGGDHTIENNGAAERDLTGRKDPAGKMEPAGEQDPIRVKGHFREKEPRKDTGREEERVPAEENESGRVKEDSFGEKKDRKDANRADEKDPAREKWSEEENLKGPLPGNVPALMPGNDTIGPDATVPPRGKTKKTRIRKKPVTPRPITEVHRKTEIFGASGNSFPEPAQIRRHTERNLKDPGFGIPYIAAEKAIHDLVCSLVEREDRMNAGIMLDIKFMQEDIGLLQDQVYKLKTTKGGAAAAGEKK